MTQLSVSMTLKKKKELERGEKLNFSCIFFWVDGTWRVDVHIIWFDIKFNCYNYLNLFRPNSQTEAYFAKNISEEPFFLSCIRVSQNISSICGFLQYTYSLHYAHFGSWKKSCYVTGTIDSNNLNLWVHKLKTA